MNKDYHIGGQVEEAQLEIAVIRFGGNIKGIVEVTELWNTVK